MASFSRYVQLQGVTKSALNEEEIRVDLHSPRRVAVLAVMTLIASVLVGVAGETAASARSGSAAAPRQSTRSIASVPGSERRPPKSRARLPATGC
jgi:hypothetical protein